MTLKERFQAKCKELQLEEKYGSCCAPNTNLRFVLGITETEVHIIWFFNGEEQRRTIELNDFLVLNLNELREIADLFYSVDKVLLTAANRIKAIEKEREHLLSQIETIETGFADSIRALITSLEQRDERDDDQTG